MSDNSPSPVDLSSLGIDLSQIFRPSWTVESTDSTARLAARFDEGDQPGGREGRHHRHGGEGSADRNTRGSVHGERTREDRNQRGGGRSPAQRGRGGDTRREGERKRDPQRRGNLQSERGPEPPPKPALEGWKLTLIPEAAAVDGIAKQVRARAKAYPLFELARLIVKLSDRYRVKLLAESESVPELFRAKADGSLWSSRKEAISHLLSHHIDKFYRRSSITTEAPKGAYSVVAECGMTGTLLGPPNHHEYQSRLLALHASRFKNLPFEVYKSRIRMIKDEALLERWKTEQSTKTVFFPNEQDTKISCPKDEKSAQNAILPPNNDASSETHDQDAPQSEGSTENVPVPVAENPVFPEPSTFPVEAMEDTAAGEVSQPEGESIPVSSQQGLSFEEVALHFNENHAAKEVEVAKSDITLSGHVALHGSTPLLRELLLRNLQELDRFPLPLAQFLGKELSSHGLHLFKAHKKIIHVSVARPRHLDREATPTAEGFCSILDYLETHPKQQRDKQWAGLLALRSEPADTTVEPSSEESLKRREQALGADLLWLLHQGHVIDFAMGNLQVAMRPVPKTGLSKDPVKAVPNQEIAGESACSEIQPSTDTKQAVKLSLSQEPPNEPSLTSENKISLVVPATE